jgi:catechol 2,3-dioxygenase-like lactoylglutathione lyase family enzyme
MLGHVGLCVPDIERAIAFYTSALGLDVVVGPFDILPDDEAARDVFGPSFRAARQAHLIGNDGVGLELFEFRDPPVETQEASYWRGGVSHLCFVAPDIEAAERRIVDAGGRIRTSRIWSSFPDRPYRFLHAEDPFGNLLELHTHPYRKTFGP